MILIVQNHNAPCRLNHSHSYKFSAHARDRLPGVKKLKNRNNNLLYCSKEIKKEGKEKDNGLVISHGLINGNGLTDGNGLTINHFSKKKSKYDIPGPNNRLEHIVIKNQHRKLLQAIIAIILIMLPLAIYLIDFDDYPMVIQIDGEFQDWDNNEIINYFDTDDEPILNPSTNLIECRLNLQNNILDFYVRSEWDIFGSQSGQTLIDNEIYKLDIFIDRDLQSTTGYQIDCLGADERIELQGQNGVITKAYSYSFDNKRENLDWKGWLRSSNVDVALEKFRLEGKHHLLNTQSSIQPKPSTLASGFSESSKHNRINDNFCFGDKNPQQLGIIIQMMDSSGNSDNTEPILTGVGTWQQLRIVDISPDNIQPFEGFMPLLGMDLIPYFKNQETDNNLPLELHSITWSGQFAESLSENEFGLEFVEFELFADENFNRFLDPTDSRLTNCYIELDHQSLIKITFSPPLSVLREEVKHYLLAINSFIDQSETKLLKLALHPSNIIGSTPIIIDIPTNSNSEMTVYLGDVPGGITIDGIFADWNQSLELVTDLDLPKLPDGTQDRDIFQVGVNVNSDTAAFSCYLSVFGNLLTGAPVPPIFYSDVLTVTQDPSSQAQNKLSTNANAIENSEKTDELPKELLGTDKISIFIDTDEDSNTGYTPNWLSIGAEYLIEITGREGIINNHELLKYQKIEGLDWSWMKTSELPVYKDIEQLETQIDWLELGLDSFESVDIVFYISDWSGKNSDMASQTPLFENIYDIPGIPTNLNEALESLDSSIDSEDLTNNNEEDNSAMVSTSTRGAIINVTSAEDYISAMPNQRKLVRDSDGYWYAFWNDNKVLMAKRSVYPNGSDWSSPAVILAGVSTPIISGANGVVYFPTVAIFRDQDNISNNSIHLVWVREVANNYNLCYSKCINITNNDNFTDPSSWCKANGSTGFDILSDNIDNGLGLNKGYPSIAIDTSGRPHVVWQYEYVLNKFKINYTMYSQANGWNDTKSEPICITPTGADFNHRYPSIDLGSNGTIHVTFTNQTVTPFYDRIGYVHCWNLSNSMNNSYWGNATHLNNQDDIILNQSSGNMVYSSMVCDNQGRVWVVTHENSNKDIWFVMEDFQNNNYWPVKGFKLEEDGDNLYPTIGYDSSDNMYCVWQHKISANDYSINMSYNSSGSWSTPIELVNGNLNIYPQIPKNLVGTENPYSFMYKNDTSNKLMFYSIPEFSDFAHIFFLLLILQMLIMTISKRKRLGKWRKTR